jgi:FAD/FMN-containing dehydrogenase/Fe-S oxidoreductase
MVDFSDLRRVQLKEYLSRHVDAEVRFDETSRRLYATDASIYQIMPAGVVIPRTVDALVSAVQIAMESRMPIIPRGGGTSLSGQSIGPGLIIDCSKYLNRIVNIDPVTRRAVVQPGVVLDQLNRFLAPYGLAFGPDVATASRANLGGMIGNNSAGVRSIWYGKTIDHIRKLTVILSDGNKAELAPVGPLEWDRRAEQPTLEGRIYREVRRIVSTHRTEIERRFPKILRRVSGYNLDALARGSQSLSDLIVGSEGTLAIITEAEIDLIAKPRCRGLLVPQFQSLKAALDAVEICLEHRPSAVELIDQYLIELARQQPSVREAASAIQGHPEALLLVEFSGDDDAEVSSLVHDLHRRLQRNAGLIAATPALDPRWRDGLWALRQAGMPLLYGMRGARKPVTFVEDCAVAPARLPEFAGRFRDILRRFGTDGAFYGHASVGCLHIRPLLDLHQPADIERMRRITEEVTDLLLEFGGALSGEHGDGLARSEWNRKMFGPVIYEAFREIKRAFDPWNLFNPGKIVDAPAMTENLRYPREAPIQLPTVYDYSTQEGFYRSIELCNGSGVCRRTHGGTMCPSFRATRDERDSTRGRANALRLALTLRPDGEATNLQARAKAPLEQRWLFDVMSLCLQCKACKTECPSNVDMAKLKSEFLHAYYRRRRRPLGQVGLAHVHRLYPWAARFAPLVNWAGRNRIIRWFLHVVAGIDRRRTLPTVHRNHLRRVWGINDTVANESVTAPGRDELPPKPNVLLLDDCFTTFHEPHLGLAARKVLRRMGCRVELAGFCCGRALLSKGYLPEARELARQALPRLAQRVRDGAVLLGMEPSCLLTVVDDWPELVPGPESRQVAAAADLVDHWLVRNWPQWCRDVGLKSPGNRVLVHGHCHQKALRGLDGSVQLLRQIPGWEVIPLATGCCGMAGAFGYERATADVSLKIAETELLPALRLDEDAAIAATGTSCRHQIRELTGRDALHPIEYFAAAIDGSTKTDDTAKHSPN